MGDSCWIGLRGGVVLGALSVVSCGATCDRNPDIPPDRYTGGITDEAAGVYETSPVAGPYLDFPAGKSYLLVHGLGGRPRLVQGELSFHKWPLPPDGRNREGYSNTTPASGNQFLIEEKNRDYVRVRNDTCSDTYLRVVAAFPEAAEPTAPDAGTSE